MNKLFTILSISLFSFSYSQYYKAELLYKDGNTEKGLLNSLVDINNRKAKKAVFKSDEKADKKVISVENVERITYFNDDGSTSIGELINFRNKRNLWAFKIKEVKDLTVYSITVHIPSQRVSGGILIPPSTYTDYLFKYKDEPADHVFRHNLGISIGEEAANKKWLKKYFADRCPKLIENMDKLDFEKESPMPFVDYYEKYCK